MPLSLVFFRKDTSVADPKAEREAKKADALRLQLEEMKKAAVHEEVERIAEAERERIKKAGKLTTKAANLVKGASSKAVTAVKNVGKTEEEKQAQRAAAQEKQDWQKRQKQNDVRSAVAGVKKQYAEADQKVSEVIDKKYIRDHGIVTDIVKEKVPYSVDVAISYILTVAINNDLMQVKFPDYDNHFWDIKITVTSIEDGEEVYDLREMRIPSDAVESSDKLEDMLMLLFRKKYEALTKLIAVDKVQQVLDVVDLVEKTLNDRAKRAAEQTFKAVGSRKSAAPSAISITTSAIPELEAFRTLLSEKDGNAPAASSLATTSPKAAATSEVAEREHHFESVDGTATFLTISPSNHILEVVEQKDGKITGANFCKVMDLEVVNNELAITYSDRKDDYKIKTLHVPYDEARDSSEVEFFKKSIGSNHAFYTTSDNELVDISQNEVTFLTINPQTKNVEVVFGSGTEPKDYYPVTDLSTRDENDGKVGVITFSYTDEEGSPLSYPLDVNLTQVKDAAVFDLFSKSKSELSHSPRRPGR